MNSLYMWSEPLARAYPKPDKLKLKVPFTKEVVDIKGNLFKYQVKEDGKVEYLYLCTVYLESSSTEKPKRKLP